MLLLIQFIIKYFAEQIVKNIIMREINSLNNQEINGVCEEDRPLCPFATVVENSEENDIVRMMLPRFQENEQAIAILLKLVRRINCDEYYSVIDFFKSGGPCLLIEHIDREKSAFNITNQLIQYTLKNEERRALGLDLPRVTVLHRLLYLFFVGDVPAAQRLTCRSGCYCANPHHYYIKQPAVKKKKKRKRYESSSDDESDTNSDSGGRAREPGEPTPERLASIQRQEAALARIAARQPPWIINVRTARD